MGGAGVQLAFTSFHHQGCSIAAQDSDLTMRIIILGADEVMLRMLARMNGMIGD